MRTQLRTDDIDNQNVSNYSYDLNGRLVSDVHDGVTLIKWSKSDKVLEVHKPNGILTIKYNALDQKISQSTSRNDSIVTEYFVYDPSGNVLATYGDTIFTTNGNHRFSLHQLMIYGSSRIGILELDSLLWKDGSSNVITSNVYTQKLGQKRYELSNHLGNVHTVLTDRKLIQGNGQNAYFVADVVSVTDYYPFGMKITERSWSSDTYRFGFNGKDFFTDWNRQDYGFRIYDSRKCRFESVDPLTSSYPWNSTYAFAENTPIWATDLDGLEANFAPSSFTKDVPKIILPNHATNIVLAEEGAEYHFNKRPVNVDVGLLIKFDVDGKHYTLFEDGYYYHKENGKSTEKYQELDSETQNTHYEIPRPLRTNDIFTIETKILIKRDNGDNINPVSLVQKFIMLGSGVVDAVAFAGPEHEKATTELVSKRLAVVARSFALLDIALGGYDLYQKNSNGTDSKSDWTSLASKGIDFGLTYVLPVISKINPYVSLTYTAVDLVLTFTTQKSISNHILNALSGVSSDDNELIKKDDEK